ncbi:MAG: RluA family pseudouridine synthase [Cyanobacteria bacterium P01_D01_bin.14]
MGLLHSPSDFIGGDNLRSDLSSRYWYTAQCPQTGRSWRLPRTQEIEAIARGLMQQLAAVPKTGTLYGVLLVETTAGDRVVLKGFSGGGAVAGWVPPLTAPAQVALAEPQVLARLAHLKETLIALKQLPAREHYRQLSQRYAAQLQTLAASHRERKRERDRKRTHYHSHLQGDAQAQALAELARESQQDSRERRCLKCDRDRSLAPLLCEIAQADRDIQTLKQQYKTLSQRWQTQLQTAYGVGRTQPTWAVEGGDRVFGDVCDRAAAKLLHYAVAHGLTPLALAEFWWGDPRGESHPEPFHGASPEDCQVLMRLAQLAAPSPPAATPLTILHQDEALIVVDKPAGLLSVPGRRYHLQDSVLSRLRCQLPEHSFLQAVHRLDRATSGVLVLATSPSVHGALGRQFAQHQVCKTYGAVLTRPVPMTSGAIELPLWGNPDERPRQSVSTAYGKPSLTHFHLLQSGERPRIQFVPHTGRTHQLRVHAAHPQGLNSPILGDSLYGRQPNPAERLHLHATSIQLVHPVTQKRLKFTSAAPF